MHFVESFEAEGLAIDSFSLSSPQLCSFAVKKRESEKTL